MSVYGRIIILLLLVEAITTGFLVYLSFQNILSEDTFAFFLAIDLVAFALCSYLFRAEKNNDLPNRPWLIVGSLIIAGLYVSSLLFH